MDAVSWLVGVPRDSASACAGVTLRDTSRCGCARARPPRPRPPPTTTRLTFLFPHQAIDQQKPTSNQRSVRFVAFLRFVFTFTPSPPLRQSAALLPGAHPARPHGGSRKTHPRLVHY